MEKTIKELETHFLLKNKFIEKRNNFLKTKMGRWGWALTKSPEKPLIMAGFLSVSVMFFLTLFLGAGSFVANVTVISYFLLLPLCASFNILTHKHAPIDNGLRREIASRLLEISERYPSSKQTLNKYAKELEEDIPYGWWWEVNKILSKVNGINNMNYEDIKNALLGDDNAKKELEHDEGIETSIVIKKKKYEKMDLI